MRKLVLVCLVMCLPSLIQAGRGESGALFLKIPIAARATALAGAFSAVSGDAATLDYNPAGLANTVRTDLNFSFVRYIEDSSLQSLSFAFPARWVFRPSGKTKKSFADSLFIGTQYRSFQSDDEFRSALGVKTGEFDIKDQFFQLGLAYAPYGPLSIGFSGKFLHSELQSETASGYAVDGGILLKLSQPLTVGLSILNVGPDIEFIREGDPLPSLVRLGAAYQWRRFLFLTDVSQDRADILRGAGAVEWNVSRFIDLRVGTFFDTTLEFTGGLGVKLPIAKRQIESTLYQAPNDNFDQTPNNPHRFNPGKFLISLDYAIQTRDEFGLSHTATLRILY